jgi:hypothetical protein
MSALRLRVCAVVAALSSAVAVASAAAGPATPAPPLPAPAGAVVTVSTTAQLQNAVASIASNTTILIAPGTYMLSSTLYVNGTFTTVAIRGATGNRDDVVIVGKGMAAASDGGVPFGIWVGGHVQGVTIADLTIRDVYYHPIILNAGVQSPLVHNVRLVNAGQQLLKSNPDDTGGGVNNGIVEYSVIEYDTTSRDDYTNGVDVHSGANWIIRHNLFRNIRAPQGMLAGPAILMWNGSSNSLVDGNTFVNCQREISMGLIDRSPADHTGGIVRNNFIYRAPGVGGDAAILVADSAGTQVLHNSVLMSGGYPNAIEYRFTGASGVTIANNLLDGGIVARDGASGSASGNVTTASASMFVDPANGNLHLKATATAALNKIAAPPTAALTDWDGDSRPSGATDIGADELVPLAPPPVPQGLRIVGSG